MYTVIITLNTLQQMQSKNDDLIKEYAANVYFISAKKIQARNVRIIRITSNKLTTKFIFYESFTFFLARVARYYYCCVRMRYINGYTINKFKL